MMSEQPWWKGGIFYQICPRSFQDSSGDGVGDLKGILSRLNYVSALGVNAIWLSPFFTSPMNDFGYDIVDYCNVDPIFGTLDDFKAIVERAHELGLKVLIDQVLNHSSEQHPWFQESRQSRHNAKADWYVWADPRDGGPPNNWLSMFGGLAWQWEPLRQQYYLHNFLASQPDLNFHCPEVCLAHLDNMRFWLELGVDGFRLDVVNIYYHHQSLQDNPARGLDEPINPGIPEENPYAQQRHLYDISQPENLQFLEKMRALLDEYGATTSVGELSDDRPLEVMAQYTAGKRIHMAYSFDFLRAEHSAEYVRRIIETTEAIINEGWPCWAFSNHDSVRVINRWGGEKDAPKFAVISMALLLSLRGTVCIYQGEELGLPEADVPFEELRDPYGIAMWPKFKGRDGSRTPMPWDGEAPNAGFTTGKPWLMVEPAHLKLAVSKQTAESSTLKRMQRLIKWRQQQPALVRGAINVLPETGEMIGLIRECEQQKLLVLINLTTKEQSIKVPFASLRVIEEPGFQGRIANQQAILPPYQAIFAEI